MIGRATIVWMLLAITAGLGLFVLKYEVAEMEARLTEINRRTLSNLETVHVLKAEWSYLNRPERLEALGRKLFALEPIKIEQTLTISDIPMRPEPMAPAAGPARVPAKTSPQAADQIPPLFAIFRRER